MTWNICEYRELTIIVVDRELLVVVLETTQPLDLVFACFNELVLLCLDVFPPKN